MDVSIISVDGHLCIHVYDEHNVVSSLQAEGFVRVYPPFINFFDMSKEALHKCDKTYPRFHAFLKVCINLCTCTCTVYVCLLNLS